MFHSYRLVKFNQWSKGLRKGQPMTEFAILNAQIIFFEAPVVDLDQNKTGLYVVFFRFMFVLLGFGFLIEIPVSKEQRD